MDESSISSAADFWRFVDTFGEIYTEDTYELKGPTKNSIPKGLVFFLHHKAQDIYSVVNTLSNIAEKNQLAGENNVINRNGLYRAVHRLVNEITKKKSGNLKRDGKNIMTFLNMDFNICFEEVQAEAGPSLLSTPKANCEPKLDSGDCIPVRSVPSPKKLRTDCWKCAKSRLSLQKSVAHNRKLKEQFDRYLLDTDSLRTLNQSLKRKIKQIEDLRTERTMLRKQVAEKTKEIEKLKNQLIGKATNVERRKRRRKQKVAVNGNTTELNAELLCIKKENHELEVKETIYPQLYEESGLVAAKDDNTS